MANRLFNNKVYTLQQDLVILEGNFVVGAVGAVGTVKGSGITSVTRADVGKYVIKLDDKYDRYLGGFSGFINLGAGSGIAAVEVCADPNAGVQDGTGVTIQCFDFAGAAADPAAASVCGFVAIVRNSSVKGKGE